VSADANDEAHTDDSQEHTGGDSEDAVLLFWERDVDSIDADDSLEAQGEDWRYVIHPAIGVDGDIIGYHLTGGDNDSSDDIGSVLIDGKRGELTLADAKAAAEANYRERYLEAQQFLDELLGDWEDDDGTRCRRNAQGLIVCRVDEPDADEVEVAVTLRDYADCYDASTRCATVSLRTVLSFSFNGDRSGLVYEIRRLMRLEKQALCNRLEIARAAKGVCTVDDEVVRLKGSYA
jgi:hypothetical protein